jgi:tetratricopeptide (TPR) repeat protein
MKMFNKTVIVSLICAVLGGLFAGCNSHAEKKQAAVNRWKRQSAVANLPVANDLLEDGEDDQVMELTEKCLAVEKENAQANLIKGKILYSQGKIEQAEAYFHRAVKYDPTLDEGWYWLGMFAQQKNVHQQALTYYEKALAQQPSNSEYIIAIAESYASKGKYDKAISFIERKIRSVSQNKELSVAQADLYLRSGNNPVAIDIYNQVLMANGYDADVIAALGYCYVIDRQWSLASDMFERLVKDATTQQRATYLELLAVISVNNNQYGKAVRYFDELSVSRREDAEIWLKMGQAALGANASKRALACSKRALVIRAGWPDAIALKGSAQYLAGDYFKSIQTFERIRGDKKLGCFAWLMSGRGFRKIGEHERAELAFERASVLDPQNKLVAYVNK